MSYLPDVFVIGAMKAGTSTFWKGAFESEYLSPSINKEVNYFLQPRTSDELEKLYALQYKFPTRFKIDISPNYSRRHLYPSVPERISKVKPEAKIIYLVREPIERIESHLYHDMYRDRLRRDNVDEYLFNMEDYIKTTCYYYQLESYLQYFAKSQILVLPMEQMKTNPLAFERAINSFLAIPDFKLPTKSYNVSEKKYLIKYHDAFHKAFPQALLGNLYHFFWYLLNKKVKRPILSDIQVNKVQQLIEPDSLQLKKEFSIDTSSWFK